MAPASNGQRIRGRVARPRVSTLPASGPPAEILEASPARIGLALYNDGTGVVYVTDDPAETNPDMMFPVPAGGSFTPGVAPFIPYNALYGLGAAGHSLRVWELVTEAPDEPARPAAAPARRPWSILRVVALALLLAEPAAAQVVIPPSATLPPQAGHAGEFLTTNGTAASWAAVGAGSIPAGVIVMWSGTLASIPSGWALCDGTAGTPDLRDRFIWGWTASVDPGGTGGSTSYTPAGSNSAPALTMDSYTPAGSNSAPTFTGSAMGTHAHELPIHNPSGNFRHLGNFFGSGTSRAGVTGAGGGLPADTTSAAVPLSQAVSAGTPAGTVSAPTFTGTAATLTGSVAAPAFTGTAATIVMPYFKLAFIIKQ